MQQGGKRTHPHTHTRRGYRKRSGASDFAYPLFNNAARLGTRWVAAAPVIAGMVCLLSAFCCTSPLICVCKCSLFKVVSRMGNTHKRTHKDLWGQQHLSAASYPINPRKQKDGSACCVLSYFRSGAKSESRLEALGRKSKNIGCVCTGVGITGCLPTILIKCSRNKVLLKQHLPNK